jgi:hypothetical protein
MSDDLNRESENSATDNQENTKSFAEKHPRWNLVIGIVLVSAIVLAAVFVIYHAGIGIVGGIEQVSNWLSNMANKLDAVVIVALITGGVSIVGVVLSSIISKLIEYKQKRREYLYRKREEPYESFIGMVYRLLEQSKTGREYKESEMLGDINEFSQRLTLWGSNDVVKKWIKFRDESRQNIGGKENLLFMEDIMYAMRKDMGLRRMKRGKLLAIFINDIRELVEK